MRRSGPDRRNLTEPRRRRGSSSCLLCGECTTICFSEVPTARS
ncbi:MAG: hypothetical protein LHV69_11670 [Elusimicrobia bacterium]|nr:hypothetical protein [Candidatus Obscuribacterium magneticum]